MTTVSLSQIEELSDLACQLKRCSTPRQKLEVLRKFSSKEWDHVAELFPQINRLPLNSQVLIYSLLAIGQIDQIFNRSDQIQEKNASLQHLIEQLEPVETFYSTIGGIVGYHLKFLELLQQMECPPSELQKYEKPPGLDLSSPLQEIPLRERMGIEALPLIAEIYPVAGAADRLDLHDESSGDPLPAAQLNFLGFTLFEGLIRDLQAKEFLYFKLTGKRSSLLLF